MWWAVISGAVVSTLLRLWRQYVAWGSTQTRWTVLVLNAIVVLFILRALNLGAALAFIVAVGTSFAFYELVLKRVFGKGPGRGR